MFKNNVLANTLIAPFFWAVSIIVARFMLCNGEDGLNLIFWASLLSLPYWLFIANRQKFEIKKLSKKSIWVLLGIAIINTAIAGIVEMYAIKYSQAINYSFLIRTVLIFTVIFAYLFLHEKITKKKIFLVILILTGSYLLCTNGKVIALSTGDMLTLLEAALISFGSTILGKISVQIMSRNISVSLSCILGTIFIIIATLVTGHFFWPKLPLLVILLSISNTLLMHFKFKAYEIASASYIAMIFSLTPVLVYVLSIIFLHESLGLIQLAGGILIITAGIMTEKLKINS